MGKEFQASKMSTVTGYITNVWGYMGSSSEEIKATFRKERPTEFQLDLIARAVTRVYESEDRKTRKKDRYEQSLRHLRQLACE